MTRVFYFCKMKEVDYIIVGCGLAGISFNELCIQYNKTCVVFEDHSQNSTEIAGGLYNPVVLKRFSEVWKAKEQLEQAYPFYHSLEKKLNHKFFHEIPLYRRLNSIEEQNNWHVATDKSNLQNYLNSKLEELNNPELFAPFKFGKVNQTGYCDTQLLKQLYLAYLNQNQILQNKSFDYNQLQITKEQVTYQDIKAKKIIFAEGFGVQKNPFFNNLPLDGTKGELLLIESSELQLSQIINSSIFILPIGKNKYKVGATYNWKDKTTNTTKEAREELETNLKELIKCEYKIIEHYAGVRPTVRDRKPLVGKHYLYGNIYIINGLGTRGVMFAPFLAHQLYNYIENNIPLDKEIDIQRIYKKIL